MDLMENLEILWELNTPTVQKQKLEIPVLFFTSCSVFAFHIEEGRTGRHGYITRTHLRSPYTCRSDQRLSLFLWSWREHADSRALFSFQKIFYSTHHIESLNTCIDH